MESDEEICVKEVILDRFLRVEGGLEVDATVDVDVVGFYSLKIILGLKTSDLQW